MIGRRNYLNMKGINIWAMGSSIGLNFFWSILVLVVSYIWITKVSPQDINLSSGFADAVIIFAFFIGPFLIAWLSGTIAADGRGPTYGFYGSMVGLIPVAIVLMPRGLLGFFSVAAILAGGFNGGLLVEAVKGSRMPEKPKNESWMDRYRNDT